MSLLQPLLFILPLGLDTLGVSLSLGIKSSSISASAEKEKRPLLPYWLRSAILFSLAEMLMPVFGLVIGYAVSLIVSDVMHYIGAVLLIGVGAWELLEEGREYLGKRKQQHKTISQSRSTISSSPEQFNWGRQLFLALSISLDELAIGFSLGSITAGKAISPITFCLLIGLQGFLLTLIGLSLGRTLRIRLKPLKEWSELLSAFLLIGLGVWLLVT
ncbi:MAG TPA: manganese efflux pump [Ktedonobacteraceae bacterium]|nr:manganese efflux pump [Ktedonobacteraceae bacterium]